MEKFMLLFRGGDTHIHNAKDSKETMEYIQSWTTWMQGLGQQGKLTGGDPLKTTGKQVIGKNKIVTEGPYMEANVMVGGYLLVNAKDMEEAVEISKGCPIFLENGAVEIRPIQQQN